MSKSKKKEVIAMAGLAALAGACGTTKDTASATADNDTAAGKSERTVPPADSTALAKRLQKLKEVRYDTTPLPIAMCYSMAAPIEENYVCPVCGKETSSTAYQNGNIRSIRGVVEGMRSIGYDVQLDESQFCHNCNGKKEDYPSLKFRISLNKNGHYHEAYSNVYDDYSNLFIFLKYSDKKEFVKSVSNNKQEAEKAFAAIEKMTGLKIETKKNRK